MDLKTPQDSEQRPGFGARLIGIVDNHANGPRLVTGFAILVILAIWAAIASHVLEQRESIFRVARQELTGGIVTLNSHTRRTVEAVNTTLRAVDAWLYETSRQSPPSPLGLLADLIVDLQAQNEDPVDIRPIGPDGYLFRFRPTTENFRAFVGDREYIQVLKDAPQARSTSRRRWSAGIQSAWSCPSPSKPARTATALLTWSLLLR